MVDLAGPPDRGTDQVKLAVDVGQVWDVSERKAGFPMISYPLPEISARRIISDPGIYSPLAISQDGRNVLVTGHVTCAKGDVYEFQTSATQSMTGALARGRVEGRCSGRTESYEAATWVYDEALFAPGPAQVCGVLITRGGGKISDVFQWCRKEAAALEVGGAGE